ncbi:MAG: phosphopantetheine-binding protein [Actinomycetales bacterium]
MQQTGSDSFESRVRASVGRYLGVPETRLLDTALLGDDLCVDSLMAAEMVTVVEDDLDLRLDDSVLDGVSTYGDFERAVRRHSGVDD